MKLLLTLFFVCLCCVAATAQQNVAKPKTADQQLSPELKEQAVGLLRQTARAAGGLNLPENRLTFLLATADMLWEHDEKAARETFQNAKNDVRELITLHMQKTAARPPDDEPNFESSFMAGDGAMEDTRSVGNIREQLILALGKHDADAAYQFMIETRPVFAPQHGKNSDSNEYMLAMRGQFTDENRENNLETRLATIVAANDPTKAFEIAKKRLAVGLFDNAPGVAVKLYLKNKETGAQFAADVFKKLKVARLDTDYLARSVAFGLLTNGANALKKAEKDAEYAKKPLLSEADLRELAEQLARAGLAMKGENYELSQFTSSLGVLEKYAPASARQLRAKIEQPKKEVAIAAPENDGDEEYRKYAERGKKERETIEAAQKSLSAEEKDFSLKQSKEILGKIKNRTQRLAMTAQLAASLAERGQKEVAAELLKEVREQLPSVPKFWGHYVEHIFVARAYAAIDPVQSFEMLENLISQFDDTLGGLVKFGEFIAGESAVRQNELRLSGMPGMMGMGMIGRMGGGGSSGAANFTSGFEKDIIALAKADFVRTASLADKFSRPEISLIAKMMIVSSLLPTKNDAEVFPSIETDEAPAGEPIVRKGVTVRTSSN